MLSKRSHSKPASIAAVVLALMGWPAPSSGQPAGDSKAALAKGTEPAKAPPPTTTTGSFGKDVYLQDISYTLRAAWIRSLTISKKNPDVAYLASWDGYVWKTTDGGKTWDESRLILEPRPFHGDAGQRLYFGVHRRGAAAWGKRHKATRIGGARIRIGGGRKLVSGEPGRTLDPFSPVESRRRKVTLGGGIRPGITTIDPGSASRAGAAGNVNFGIGLPGGAPRLQNVVRKFGKPTSGLNIKQTLLLRGVRPTEVRLVVIHPHNDKIVFACTFFGLFKSYDGGLNWVRTFQGINPRGRMAFSVAVDPQDDRRVLLATGNGLYVSDDGGENFIKSTAQGVGSGTINWVQYNPYDSRYVFVCTDFGLLRSGDRGRTWDWIYFTTFPAARIVRFISIDPFDKKTAYIGTYDGMFVTPDVFKATLEDWRRFGGLRFTSHEVAKIVPCPKHKGHLWAQTNMRLPRVTSPGFVDTGGALLWESIDGGKNWKVIFSGETQGSMQWFDNDPRDPDLLWIAWSRALSKMVRRKPGAKPPDSAKVQRRVRKVMVAYPSQSDVLIAALRFTGTEASRRLDYRRRSRLKALVPRLDASYTYWRSRYLPVFHQGLYLLPFRLRETIDFHYSEFRVMATWDLSDWVFNLNASFFGRIQRVNGEIQGYLIHTIHRLYGELSRLRALMASRPPKDFRVRVIYKLRMEELESYVDLITGGYLTRYKRGDHPSPWKTPWFERWPGVRRAWFKTR